ncbi:MAG TPA: hypothetical protein VHS96_14815, partial [Bacteroidia bacterium]|nr:hypothetical protein [Bacteroidia bacterium]
YVFLLNRERNDSFNSLSNPKMHDKMAVSGDILSSVVGSALDTALLAQCLNVLEGVIIFDSKHVWLYRKQ